MSVSNLATTASTAFPSVEARSQFRFQDDTETVNWDLADDLIIVGNVQCRGEFFLSRRSWHMPSPSPGAAYVAPGDGDGVPVY